MPWLQVKVLAGADTAPAVEEALTTAGAIAVTLEDAGEQDILEPSPGEMPLWGATRVIALFEDTAERDAIADALAGFAEAEAGTPVFEHLPDREWARAWLTDWSPLKFGRRLWVAPQDARVDEAGAVVVRLDPGLAFGTGTHPTTALCLEWLEAQDLSGQRVLDFGCGSGILAIAALRLGASRAHGVDIDPQALEATMDNADANGVAERLSTADADHLGAGPFDILVANILAAPLAAAARTLAAVQPPGSRIALAGILASQADDVVAAYGDEYALEATEEREGWVLITGVRRENAS